jgi:predicted nucleotidyltransferase component of viral defense system
MSNVMQFKAKIKNLALSYHIPAQAVLQNYMLERLLERISLSKFQDRVILKGGMLIASMVGISSRTTMDMDATLRNFPLTEETIKTVFLEICDTPLDDEVFFTFDHITPIREDDEYGGFRIILIARFASIQTPLKIDVTTGDIITPEAICYSFPSAFEDKSIEVWAYNLETILAEKVETILRRSVLNTRPRDFYDVYILMKTHSQDIKEDVFRAALIATAQKRMSLEAIENWHAIIRTIQADAIMRVRWDRYCQEYYYAHGIAFDDVFNILKTILWEEKP